MKRREFLIATAGIAGSALPGVVRAQASPCPPPTIGVDGGLPVSSVCVAADAESDWLLRTGQNPSFPQPGVVWFHDFRSKAEVDAFRWTPGYGSGNDPLAVGSSRAQFTRRNTTDGITGGGCLEIVRQAGSSDTSEWWRPFSPLTGTGNGRGVNDPGADGTLTPRSYLATDGGNQVSNWGSRGFYGHSTYHALHPGAFDGTEYYLQVRVKMDPNRIAGGNASVSTGKLFYFTRCDRSLTDQEIVTESAQSISGRNYFSMYRSGSPPLESDAPGVGSHGYQPGTEFGAVGDGVCRFDNDGGRLANCWYWPAGEWVTILYHVRNGLSGNNDTLVEVWAAKRAVPNYTRIWRQPGADLPFDIVPGHNALICSGYMNGQSVSSAFYHRYDQFIFSKAFIPCPQV